MYPSKGYQTAHPPPPSSCASVFAPTVSIRQQTSRQHTFAHTGSPGLARHSFRLLCQYLYFCTGKASKLKFTVFLTTEPNPTQLDAAGPCPLDAARPCPAHQSSSSCVAFCVSICAIRQHTSQELKIGKNVFSHFKECEGVLRLSDDRYRKECAVKSDFVRWCKRYVRGGRHGR
jgi:hypothetical protein